MIRQLMGTGPGHPKEAEGAQTNSLRDALRADLNAGLKRAPGTTRCLNNLTMLPNISCL